MQVRDFKKFVHLLADTVGGSDGHLLQTLSEALPNRAGTLATFLNATKEAAPSSDQPQPGPFLVDALPILTRAQPFLKLVGKQAAVADFQQFIEWSHQKQDLSIAALAALLPPPAPAAGVGPAVAVRDHVVREHAERLASLRPGSPALSEALETLANDRQVRQQEMVAIAQLVADPKMAASTKKPAALKRIRLAHDAYLDSAARSSAISGRGAHGHT